MKKQYIGNIYIITSVQTLEDPSSPDFNGPYVIEEEMYAHNIIFEKINSTTYKVVKGQLHKKMLPEKRIINTFIPQTPEVGDMYIKDDIYPIKPLKDHDGYEVER